ncbi:L-fuco-beta-pyranose dehydrogenase [[Actinomadura] parvosata subsp. kistnae]|nr:L-fuco-beta-pyranose dehydrogenase [Actinomadura parvosata subsp. kistnae]
MQIKRLGGSSVEVTELGFGGGPLGGLFTATPEDEAAEALAAAWEGGVRYFDTSPHYGIGQSERLIGRFLSQKPRDEYVLSTKVGRLLVPQDPQGRMDEFFQVPATHRRVWDFSRDGIRRSVEDSLTRMGVDRFDVLFLHDAEEHFEDALCEGAPALAELRAEGLVGAIGAGMYDTGLLTRLVREADVDVIMLSAHYTLLRQPALDDLLPACAERGVSVLAASVFNSGILATPRPRPRRALRVRARAGGGAGARAPHRRRLPGPRRDAARGGPGLPPAASGGRRRRGRHALGRGGAPQPGLVQP